LLKAKRILVGISLLLAVILPVQAATWNIVYPQLERNIKAINEYPVALLDIALKETGVKYSVNPSKKLMDQERAMKHLLSNREVNVVWDSTDKNRERQLLPIRIPMYKGLIGWRVFFITPDSAVDFSALRSLEQLKIYSAVQAEDWLDTKVLQANGLKVDVGNSYADLFDMVKADKMRYFPRSVVEIAMEMEQRQNENLIIEPNIGIHYPMAFYFFVNKKDRLLARLLQVGLEKAINNGSFDRLFMQYHGKYLQQLNMPERHFIPLTNPSLPKDTPLDTKKLWYQAN